MILKHESTYKFVSDQQVTGFKAKLEDETIIEVIAKIETDEQGVVSYVAEIVNPTADIIEVTPYVIQELEPEVIIEEM